jgi:thymidylate synthase
MSTWIPWMDHAREEPPCIMVVDLKVCKEALTLVAYIRSNDILMAWGENVVGLTAILVNTAKNLNMRVGYLETISRDAHVYFRRDQNYLRSMGIMYDI